jgi:uncharacterized protein (TIGR03435 family)
MSPRVNRTSHSQNLEVERRIGADSRPRRDQFGAARLAAGAVAIFLVAFAAATFGQSVATPAFEAADVRVSPPRMNVLSGMAGGAIRNGFYEVRNATMLDLIRTAYGVQGIRVVDGPSWLEVDTFDIVAKVPAGASVETARLMLRGVLADRFKLTLREEQRETQTWVLSQAGGGAKLVRSENSTVAPACPGQPEPPNIKLVCRSMTLAGFSDLLSRAFSTYVSGPVTDATGLAGAWDFEFVFTSKREELAALGAKGISLFAALAQLGLTLEQKPFATANLVVASVSRTPSANVPGIEKVIPPRPAPEFEVATVKRGPQGVTVGRNVIRPNGQIDATNVPLRELIKTAWGFESNDRVVGPEWIETARFDVVGRAYSGADAQFIDIDYLRLALRQLLVDRFQIKFHYEDRPITAYALVAGSVKMTKANPASRTRCYQGVPPGAKDPRQENRTRRGLVTCQNATMQHFARLLPAVAGTSYIQNPIADMTGLAGGWDFTLNWSTFDLFPAGVAGVAPVGDRPPEASAVPVAPTPTGAITLQEAVESQLGLKLQMGKHPAPVLVIDQISEQPIEN